MALAPVGFSAQESSSSSLSRASLPRFLYRYHVFLSFRGKDTRDGFIGRLYTALVNAELIPFRDDRSLERGEDIEAELERAIHQSRISVIVFSEGYADSRWCLDELDMILERKHKFKDDHVILPVFYDVDPSDFRKQTGSVSRAFALHKGTESLEKLKAWRAALEQVANLAGIVLQKHTNWRLDFMYETSFIRNIVEVIKEKLYIDYIPGSSNYGLDLMNHMNQEQVIKGPQVKNIYLSLYGFCCLVGKHEEINDLVCGLDVTGKLLEKLISGLNSLQQITERLYNKVPNLGGSWKLATILREWEDQLEEVMDGFMKLSEEMSAEASRLYLLDDQCRNSSTISYEHVQKCLSGMPCHTSCRASINSRLGEIVNGLDSLVIKRKSERRRLVSRLAWPLMNAVMDFITNAFESF
ncbi:hypothetical protein ACLB2K_061045 [Fragaria x ananassa]